MQRERSDNESKRMGQTKIGTRRDRCHEVFAFYWRQLYCPQSVRGMIVSGMHRQWCANANRSRNLFGLFSSTRQKRKYFDREQPPANAQEKSINTANDGGGGGKDAAASDPMPATAAAGAVVEGVDGVDTVGMAAYEVGATGEV